eukprot:14059365-Alexandrium_andersonii.AAC.1
MPPFGAFVSWQCFHSNGKNQLPGNEHGRSQCSEFWAAMKWRFVLDFKGWRILGARGSGPFHHRLLDHCHGPVSYTHLTLPTICSV